MAHSLLDSGELPDGVRKAFDHLRWEDVTQLNATDEGADEGIDGALILSHECQHRSRWGCQGLELCEVHTV